MPVKRYKRSKQKYIGGDTKSYAMSMVPFPKKLFSNDIPEYFFENEHDLVCNITGIPKDIEHTPSVSVVHEDMEHHDTDVLMGMLGDKPYYVCYAIGKKTAEFAIFYAIREHSFDSILKSRIAYMNMLRIFRQAEEIDTATYLKALVRDPAYAVPIGIYLIIQKARRVRHEVVEEEFNRPSYHRKKITYNAYEILPNDIDYLMDDPMPGKDFWDTGFRIDIDEIFMLCKHEIDFAYLSKSITKASKDTRVLVVFGHDDKGKMRGIRVLLISKNKEKDEISYWGKFACAEGLGAIIQNKSLEILRTDLAYLATTIKGEKFGENSGPVLRSWTNPKYSNEYQYMRFRAINSAISFWQYLGYSIYKMATKGDAFFKAKALPSDASSVNTTKRKASRSRPSSESPISNIKKTVRK